MELRVLTLGARFAVLELCGGGFYETEEYEIYLNGTCYGTSNQVITTVRQLLPETSYHCVVRKGDVEGTVSFVTKAETVTLNVRDFGAKGDGVTDDTMFLQTAILACPAGGRVLVPEGVYRVTSVFLKSHVCLELAKGAVLSAFTERERFPVLPGSVPAENEAGELLFGTWEGEREACFAGILTGIDVEDVTVTGEGIIDGNATWDNWWKESKVKKIAWRPRLLYLCRCKHVTVEGITVQNSPSWTIHPYFSEELRFYNLHILNPSYSPNTDGLNPESCKKVEIAGVYFSVGDDCIAVKSGKLAMGEKYKTPSEEIVVRHCHMQDGHGAVTIGSECAGGVKKLYVQDCIFCNTDRGLRIKTRRGRGKQAVVDDVCFERIVMDGVLTPVVINAFYFCDADGHSDYVQTKTALPVDDRTPRLGSFLFRDITAKNCHIAAAYLYGLPEYPMECVRFERFRVSFAKEAKAGIPAMHDDCPELCRAGIVAKEVAELVKEQVEIEEGCVGTQG